MAVDDVQRYYDNNTPSFETFGANKYGGAIRRAVWGPGVRSREEAFQYVDQQIVLELQALRERFEAPLRVLDFGCGLGTSLLFLAAHAQIEGTGITISEVQAQRAATRIRDAGLTQRVRCMAGDFLKLSESIAPAHLVLSIEAFVHSPSPEAYFAAAARQLLPGGTLVVCDDFLTGRSEGSLSRRERRWIDEFRHGWVASSTVTTEGADAAAQRAGFALEKNVDLTPYIELRRPRDRALTLLVSVARHLPIPGYRWRSLLGGNALQLALRGGVIEHRFVVWRRAG